MQRSQFLDKITAQFAVHPICALLGPHQAGKTTLAQAFATYCQASTIHTFDLENLFDRKNNRDLF